MKRKSLFIVLAAAVACAVVFGVQAAASSGSSQLTAAQLTQFTAQDANLATLMDAPAATDPPAGTFSEVSTHIYDPGDTDTVQSKWLNGTGCLNATATHNTSNPNGSYTDSVCAASYDPKDEENSGLLLEKGGPTPTNSAAFAELKNVKGITLTELGYDIRTLGPYPDSNSSHCGAGAPRFNVETADGTVFFVGCRSPLADSFTSGVPGSGDAWTRLRWGVAGTVMGFCSSGPSCLVPNAPNAITGAVQHIFVVFDEGTDTAPDYYGAAFLDNIDVNGQLVGRG
jgi:hypothetical protein